MRGGFGGFLGVFGRLVEDLDTAGGDFFGVVMIELVPGVQRDDGNLFASDAIWNYYPDK